MNYELIRDLDKKDKIRFAMGLLMLIISALILLIIDTKGEMADKINECTKTYSLEYCNMVVK